MTSTDDLNALMAEIGPLDDGILAVARIADDRWTVQFEDVDVEIEFDEASGRVMLSAPIGAPPPLRAASIYEALLSYGMLWRETGGVRMALTGPGGEVLQMVDVPAADLRPALLVTVAVNLANRTAIWRGFFADPAAEAPAPAETGNVFTMIRV